MEATKHGDDADTDSSSAAASTETEAPAYERGDCVIISAPGWFGREDFLRWLRTNRGLVATWDAGGGESTEYSDAFITFDCGGDPGADGENVEGSNFNGGGENAMPEDIEREIKRELAARGVSYGVAWIKPV